MKYLSKLTSTTCNLEGVDGILTGNQNLYGAATGETWDYYVRVTDEGGFVDSLYAAANGIGDYGNSFLTGIVYAEGGFLTGGTVKAQNVLTQGIGAKGSFGLSVDNTNVITALSSGNVGIGTTSPIAELHVQGTSTEQVLISYDSTRRMLLGRATGYGWIQPYTNGVSYDNLVLVRDGGNVGIGTTSPTQKLDVAGNIVIPQGSFLSFRRSGLDNPILWQGDGTFGSTDQLYLRQPNNNNLHFQTNGGNTRMLITGAGNVGIGTSSPAQKLHVVGNVRIDDGYTLSWGADTTKIAGNSSANTLSFKTASTDRLYINSSGNVGIGTTAPAQKLSVNGAIESLTDGLSEGGQVILRAASGGTRRWNIDNYSTSSSFRIFHEDDSTQGGGSVAVLINSSGNVGIGTTSPSSPLDVLGKVSINTDGTLNWGNAKDYGRLTWDTGKAIIRGQSGKALSLGANGTQDYLYITTAGNVGIGTTSPASDLHVNSSNNVGITLQHATRPTIALTDGTNYGYIGLEGGGNIITGTTDNDLSIRSPRNIVFGGNSIARVTIENTGNVGIGTTAPGSQLHVSSSSTSSTSILVGNTSTGSSRIYFDAQNGDFAGNDYGYIGQADSGYMEYNVGTASPAPYHVFTNGNVGIGTTSPSAKLHVVDNIVQALFQGSVQGAINISKIGTSGFGIYSSAAGTLQFYDNDAGSNRLTIASTGNVGIGTTSPGAALHVQSSATKLLLSNTDFNTSTSTGSGLILQTGASSGNTFGMIYAFQSGNTSYANLVVPGGNVGIGTTSPDQKLHVHKGSAGAVGSNGNTIITAENSTNGYVQILVPDANESGILFGRPTSDADGGILYNSYVSRGLEFRTGGNAVRMVVNSSGNVGIGTTSPGAKLHVIGTNNDAVLRIVRGNATSQYLDIRGYEIQSIGNNLLLTADTNQEVWIGNSTNNKYLLVNSAGNVGIGTTSPSYKLDVNGGISRVTYAGFAGFEYHNTAGIWEVYIGTENNSGHARYNSRQGDHTWYANGSPTMKLTSAGNVGIGTTSPSARLNVSGTGAGAAIDWSNTTATTGRNFRWVSLNSGGFAVEDLTASGANRLTINSSGNVGIGTTVPGAKTHISGGGFDVYLDYSTTNSSIGISSLKKTDGKSALVVGRTHSTNNSAVMRFDYVGDNNAANYLGLGFYANDDLMVIKPSGNVGIGTTSPGEKLDVVGNIKAQYDGNNYSRVGQNSGGGYLQAYSGAVEKVMLRSYGDSFINGGNVGIGTSIPAAKLDVAGAGYFSGESLSSGLDQTYTNVALLLDEGDYIYTKDSSTTLRRLLGKVADIIYIGQTGTSLIDGIQLQPGTTNGYVSFYNDNSEYARFQGGNLGIGTTSPDQKLHVVGGTAKIESDGGAAAGAILELKHANNNTTDVCATINMTNNAGGYAAIEGGTTGANNTGYIAFKTDNAGTQGEAMRIIGNGNVGVGTASPVANLQVGSVTTSVYSLAVGKVDIIDTNKDITDTQMGTLNITSTSRSSVSPFNQGFGPSITFTQNGSGYVNGYERVIGGIKTEIKNSTNLNFASIMQFYTHNNTELSPRMTIDGSNGNVGIGTTSPSQKLDVSGHAVIGASGGGYKYYIKRPSDGSASAFFGYNSSDNTDFGVYNGSGGGNVKFWSNNGIFQFNNVASSELMRITSGGNVLIGTTTDAGYKLRVNGTSFFDGLAWFGQNSANGSAFRWGELGTAVSTDTMLAMNQLWNGSGWTILNSAIGTSYLNLGGAVASPDIAFGTGAANTVATPKMIIKNSGNVGIGTISPDTNLEIEVSSAGGTPHPYSRFHVKGDIYAAMSIGSPNNGSGWYMFGDTDDAYVGGMAYDHAVDAMYFNVNNNTALYVNSSRNVGIGTTSPSSKLQLGEDASTLGSNVFTMYRGGSTGQYTTIENQGGTVYKSHGVGGHAFYHDPAQEAMRVAATTGNLLVGTSTDAGYRLDVQGGDARFAQNVDAASYSVAGNPGWSGTVNFPTNPPGQQNLQFANGILVNVF